MQRRITELVESGDGFIEGSSCRLVNAERVGEMDSELSYKARNADDETRAMQYAMQDRLPPQADRYVIVRPIVKDGLGNSHIVVRPMRFISYADEKEPSFVEGDSPSLMPTGIQDARHAYP